MTVIANLMLVVAGSFLAGFASLVLEQVPSNRRLVLAGVALAGCALVIAKVPFGANASVALLASAAYAIGAALATVLVVSRAVEKVDVKNVRTLAIAMGASLVTMVGLLWFVTGIAHAG